MVVLDLKNKVVYAVFGLLVHSAVYIGILISAFWRSLLPLSPWYFSPESGSETLRYIYTNLRGVIFQKTEIGSGCSMLYCKPRTLLSAFLSFVLFPQIRDGQDVYHIWQEGQCIVNFGRRHKRTRRLWIIIIQYILIILNVCAALNWSRI